MSGTNIKSHYGDFRMVLKKFAGSDVLPDKSILEWYEECKDEIDYASSTNASVLAIAIYMVKTGSEESFNVREATNLINKVSWKNGTRSNESDYKYLVIDVARFFTRLSHPDEND